MKIKIEVNGVRYGPDEGVSATMAPRAIAGLLGLKSRLTVRKVGGRGLDLDAEITVLDGDVFLVDGDSREEPAPTPPAAAAPASHPKKPAHR